MRKLTVPGAHKTKAQRLFKDVLKIAARGVAWQEQAIASSRSAPPEAGSSSRSELGAVGEDTARTQSASIFAHRSDIPPFASLVLGKVLARVAAALQEVPPQARLELTRAFNRADADRSGFIEEHEVKDMLCDLKGSAVSNAEASAMKALIDADGDGRISLPELIDGISKIPLTRVPLEHDTEGIVAAEFVAVVYEMAGLLPRRRTHVVNYTKLVPAGSELPSSADAMSTMGGLRQRASDEADTAPSAVRFNEAVSVPVASGAGQNESSSGAAAGQTTPQSRNTSITGEKLPHATRISFAPAEPPATKPAKHHAVLKRGGTEGRILVGNADTVDKGYATVRRDARKGTGGGFGLALRTFASELEEETHGNIVVIHSGKAPTHHYAPVSFCASAEPSIKLQVGSLAPEVPLLLRSTDVDD